MFLGILVGFEQQIDQAGDRSCIPQRGLVLRAQGQVTDQADGRLKDKEILQPLISGSLNQFKQTTATFCLFSILWARCNMK